MATQGQQEAGKALDALIHLHETRDLAEDWPRTYSSAKALIVAGTYAPVIEYAEGLLDEHELWAYAYDVGSDEQYAEELTRPTPADLASPATPADAGIAAAVADDTWPEGECAWCGTPAERVFAEVPWAVCETCGELYGLQRPPRRHGTHGGNEAGPTA